MQSFTSLPRADTFVVHNTHDIYRKYKVPGLRSTDSYEGTGVEKTYNMCQSDADYPGSVEAVPALLRIDLGNGDSKSIMRKEVEYQTLICDSCDVEGVVGNGEKFCPECGIILTSNDAKTPDQRIERTPAAAGRYNE